jgi:sulfite exporter TauE/SafE
LDQHALLSLLELGLAQCGDFLSGRGGALAAMLLAAGLAGGIGHCPGMCGPLVLAQVGARLERVPAARMGELHRLAAAALLPYHLGRATAYGALGAAAATATQALGSLPGLRWLSAVLLLLAAAAFLAGALRRVRIGRAGAGGCAAATGGPWARALAARVRALLGAPTGLRGYALGVALGFLPCGQLYGALAAAAAGGEPATGALGMLAFALGTAPGLVAIGWAGHLAGRVAEGPVRRAAPLLMAVNAAVLGFMAWSLAAS